MAIARKLTTAAACRVARLNRDRFNEFVAAGAFGCAPQTVPGRSRLFDPNDMIALWLFRELMDDGFSAQRAGDIACSVAQAAREHPDAPIITYVQDYFPVRGYAFPFEKVPPVSEWETAIFPAGSDIRRSTNFRISKLRAMIEHYTDQEFAVAGEDD